MLLGLIEKFDSLVVVMDTVLILLKSIFIGFLLNNDTKIKRLDDISKRFEKLFRKFFQLYFPNPRHNNP
jgi:hypothetical protein